MPKQGNTNAKKQSELLRTNRLNFKLNDVEMTVFNARRGAQNNSDFIRGCILDQEIKTVYVDREKVIIKNKLAILRTELGRIGNNINQLTKIINAEYKKGTVSTKFLDVQTHLLKLEDLLEMQKKVLGNLAEFN